MRRTTAALALASALLAAACSSSESGTATPAAPSSNAEGSSTSAAAEPSTEDQDGGAAVTDYEALLLEQADFPASFEVQALDAAAIEGFASSLDGSDPEIVIDPPECADTSPFSSLDDLALVVAVDTTTGASLAQAVGPADDDLGALAEQQAACTGVTVTLPGPDGAPITGTADVTVLDEPDVDADVALALLTATTIEIPGTGPFSTVAVNLVAQVGDVSVSINGSTAPGDTDTTELEQTLADLLVVAIEKVRAA